MIRFFRKIPRGQIYLGFSELIFCFFGLLFSDLKKGRKTEEFETAFSQYCQTKSALALPRARLAFYYILKNLNLAPSSRVLMTPLTITDMVNMIHLLKLKPVFCDLAEQTYNINYEELENKITPETKVLLITHLNGLATDMGRVMEIVKKHKLILIEDCSQALGARFNNQPLGSFGQAGIFSLSFLKTCSTLFGGMLVSNDTALVEKIKNDIKDFMMPSKSWLLSELIRNFITGLATNRLIFSAFTYYLIKLLGFFNGEIINRFFLSNLDNFLREGLDPKMLLSYTDFQAEMGLSALAGLEEKNEKLISNTRILFSGASSQTRERLPKIIPEARNVFWRLPIRVDEPEKFIKYMLENYIDATQTNLVLCSQEPIFKQYSAETPEAYNSKFKTVFVPIHSDFSQEDMIYIAQTLNNYLENYH